MTVLIDKRNCIWCGLKMPRCGLIRDTFVVEHETAAYLGRCEGRVDFGEAADALEGGHAHGPVALESMLSPNASMGLDQETGKHAVEEGCRSQPSCLVGNSAERLCWLASLETFTKIGRGSRDRSVYPDGPIVLAVKCPTCTSRAPAICGSRPAETRIRPVLVFLDLLQGDAEPLGQVGLRRGSRRPSQWGERARKPAADSILSDIVALCLRAAVRIVMSAIMWRRGSLIGLSLIKAPVLRLLY
jgi:hypothetical protein